MARNDDAEALRGKVVVVTGSGRGLGSALARAAAQRHARVVINFKNNRRCAEALAAEAVKLGAEALAVRADVTDPEQARGLVDEAVKAFGRVDVLVNTVGSFSWKPVAEIEPAEWRGVIASNLDSVYYMSRLALPHMRQNHWGRIVSLGAVGAERTLGSPKVSAYCAAKAGVIAFSKALALEEARFGITVNVVSPGVLSADGERKLPAPEHAADLADRVPVGRVGGVEDVVRAVLFFASPSADFVTGQVLAVAGGWQL